VALQLRGKIVTFDEARPLLEDGVVYVGEDGKIAAVLDAGQPAPAGFAAAKRIDTKACIYPGLIDLHSHIAYNTLPLWEAKGVPYRDHKSWTRELKDPDYSSAVSLPAKVVQRAEPEALLKYVEVKALVGGTTSIQGAPKTTKPVQGWLVRVIDNERFGGNDLISCAALQRRSTEALLADAKKLAQGGVLIYHVAEGTPQSKVLQEFTDLANTGCVRPGLIGVHATALQKSDFVSWEKSVTSLDPKQRATIAWSPFSNLWLYAQTTDVAAAHAQKIRITLGSDWSPSGTKHVLGELKVADIVNKRLLGNLFSDLELCEMVTLNPGEALARAGARIGQLVTGAEADLAVITHGHPDPYRNLIAARERDIQLVMVRGNPYYGTPQLMKAAEAKLANRLTVAGEKRSVVVRQPGQAHASLSWPEVIRRLEAVRRHPRQAYDDALNALAAWGGSLDDPDAPLVIFGDMPEGDGSLLAGGGQIPDDLTMPPLDPLHHDAAFFDAIDRVKPPQLARLRDYYT
jgi:cytosine/adenosine deaminase-related metal-dependent hydrolase